MSTPSLRPRDAAAADRASEAPVEPGLGTRERATDLGEEEITAVVGRRDPALARPARGRPQLVMLVGESVGRTYPLEQLTVIGRGDDAKVRLEDEGVSRRHARIVRMGGHLCIEDLQSANGTRVNNEPITQRILRAGDRIHLGVNTILKFTDADSVEEGFHEAMYEAAVRDALTGVYNRRYFSARLAPEVAYSRRHRSPLSLLMLDIDHFKQFNDKHGHPAGDYVLATLGKILIASVRTEDLVARYGGEEFAILCRATPPMGALQLAERLRRSAESHAFVYGDRRIAFTLSIGVAMCPAAPAPAQQLVQTADAALYEAKCSGRNRVVLHPPAEKQ